MHRGRYTATLAGCAAALAFLIPRSAAFGAASFPAGAAFDTGAVVDLAPGQPWDAFFGECPSLAHRGGTTWFVYADASFDIHAIAREHATGALSAPAFVGAGWNDHLRPAILAGDDGYLHVLYGARPRPLRYHRSLDPLDHDSWSGYEQVGTSATYPVPYICDGTLSVIYREGDSYLASLSLASRDLDLPMGTPGAWRTTTVVAPSTVFVPMPLAAFERNGEVCFLFNMRDALLSSPHTPVAPSVREGMSVVCTRDGAVCTDIDGDTLDLPLDYTVDRSGFPEVTRPQFRRYRELHDGKNSLATGGLRHDGSFVTIEFLASEGGHAEILVGDGAACSCIAEFTAGGDILLSDGTSSVRVGEWTPSVKSAVDLVFHFSAGLYRPRVDGALAADPLGLDVRGPAPASGLAIDSVTVLSRDDCVVGFAVGRSFKLITASACLDSAGDVNLFFIDRLDSSVRSRWRLMHQRGETTREIGDTLTNWYHPSSILAGDRLCVAAARFEGAGLFLDNEHLTASSRIVMLGGRGDDEWDEAAIAGGGGGHVHPIFKRADESGLVELVWARIVPGTSAVLMHGVTGEPDTLFPDPLPERCEAACFPNPCSSEPCIRLAIDAPARVDVTIYDAAGRRVRRLIHGLEMQAGERVFRWDGHSDGGRPVAPGAYFARVRAGGFERSLKIMLIR